MLRRARSSRALVDGSTFCFGTASLPVLHLIGIDLLEQARNLFLLLCLQIAASRQFEGTAEGTNYALVRAGRYQSNAGQGGKPCQSKTLIHLPRPASFLLASAFNRYRHHWRKSPSTSAPRCAFRHSTRNCPAWCTSRMVCRSSASIPCTTPIASDSPLPTSWDISNCIAR